MLRPNMPPLLRAAGYLPAYNNPGPSKTVPYLGTDHTVRTMIDLAKGTRGEQSIKVRRHTEQIIKNVRPKDYAAELIAICKWWGNAGRYTRDPLHVELVKDPERMVDDSQMGILTLDCDDFATAIGACCLVIGADVNFVTVGFKPRFPGAPRIHTHVFARAQDPRTKVWYVLDPVAGRRTNRMLSRVQQYTIFDMDGGVSHG